MARGRRGKSGSEGAPSVSVDVDTSSVDRFGRALPGAFSGEASEALRRLGEQVVADATRKLRSGPRGKYGTDSRARAARGIGFKVKSGRLVLVSDPSTMPTDRRAFPAAWNTGRWTHPVYGGRARVSQRGGKFWEPESYGRAAEQLLTDAGQRALDKAGK